MKALTLILASISFSFLSTAFAAGAQPVTTEEAQMVLRALSSPENPSGFVLRSTLETSHFEIDVDSLVVKRLAADSYEVVLSMNQEDNVEKVKVHISEVRIQDGKSYIFGFDMAREIPIRKSPGVSMGNR